MTLDEIESNVNQVLTASPVFVHCICMHEYSIRIELYALSIQVETEAEISWKDGSKVVVNADYRHRTERSFSILKLTGERVSSCRFDDEKSLVLEISGGASLRCIAVEPVESYVVCGIAEAPLFLP